MKIPAIRQLNLAGFVACAGMMAFALYVQHVLLLSPCPLCIFQRFAVIGVGALFLLAALHNPSTLGGRVYAGLILLVAGTGMGVAGRHAWLQNLPPDKVPSCGPGLDYILESFPLADALKLVFTGSGECATIDWQFLGLSMPFWVFISLLALAVFGVWNNLRAKS